MKAQTIPLLFSFSVVLIFLASSGYAYQSFAFNPHFDTNSSGVNIMYDGTTSLNYSYNATCSGRTGCLFIETNETPTLTDVGYNVQIRNKNSPISASYLYPTLPNDSLEYNELPANTEGIVILSYRLNATQANVPFVTIFSNTNGIVGGENLNATPDVWFNKTWIINASSAAQNISVLLGWFPDNAPTTLMIDKFMFYTYDNVIARTTPFDGTEYETLCGNASSSGGLTFESLISTTYPLAVSAWRDKDNTTYYCCATQLGNFSITRRCTVDAETGLGSILNSRDLITIRGNGCNNGAYADYLIIERLIANSITYTSYTQSTVPAPCINQAIHFSTDGYFFWGNYQGVPAINLNTSGNGTIQFRTTKTLSSGFPMNLTGTSWYDKSSYIAQSGNYPLLYTNLLNSYVASTAGIYCDATTSQQYQMFANGTIGNVQSCGDCGCSAHETKGFGCNYPVDVGTTCLNSVQSPARTGYVTKSLYCNATDVYGDCPEGQFCVAYTTTTPTLNTTPSWYYNTIGCINGGGKIEGDCVDQNGNSVSCASITTTNTTYETGAAAFEPTYETNPLGSLAVLLFSVAGVTDSSTALAAFSVVLALVIGFGALYLTRNSKQAPAAFAIATLAALVAFTVMGWFPIVLMIVMSIIASLILVKTLNIGG